MYALIQRYNKQNAYIIIAKNKTKGNLPAPSKKQEIISLRKKV